MSVCHSCHRHCQTPDTADTADTARQQLGLADWSHLYIPVRALKDGKWFDDPEMKCEEV